MGVENLLLIFLCVVYGYHATVLLFGTSHCLALILGKQQQQVLVAQLHLYGTECFPQCVFL